jgi:hypothetical protein
MKKSFILLFLFLSASLLFSADVPNEIAKININMEQLIKEHQFKTVEFCTASKKSLGKFTCIDVLDIFDNNIKKLTNSERKRLIIIAESADGEVIATDYLNFDKNNIKIPPLLIFSFIKGSVGDTVRISDVKGSKGKVDLEMVEKELQKTVVLRIFLQMKNISVSDIQKYFKDGSMLFPQDQTCERWLENVKYLKLYIVK